MKFLSELSFRKLSQNKNFTIPFSILLAFILWLTLTVSQKDTMDRTFANATVNINLENTFVAENKMSIIGDISEQKFTVVLRGPSYVVSALTQDDFNLYASAAEVDAPGDFTLKVAATKNTPNADYEILSISPSTITVNFDYIETKEFTIKATAEGVAAEEGLIAETGVVGGTEKDTVTISGPRTTLNKIENVVALAQVNKTLSKSETFDASIVLYDEENNIIPTDNLTLSATNVKVTVPISKKKNVPVKIAFSNLPKDFDVSTLKTAIDHPFVTIIGTPETIDKTTEVTLSAIDISTISSATTSFDISPKLPEGVRLLDSIDHFTVSLNLSGYIEKTITVTEHTFTNVSSGLKASSSTTIQNVKIFGPRSAVNKISSANAYAVCDLTDKKAGEHTVDVIISFEDYNNVWAIGAYKTSVTLK